MNNNLYFKQGFFIGTFFSASLTYLLTNVYIDKYYILIPKNMDSFIESYKRYK